MPMKVGMTKLARRRKNPNMVLPVRPVIEQCRGRLREPPAVFNEARLSRFSRPDNRRILLAQRISHCAAPGYFARSTLLK
jgi:hypothetical protein